MFTMIWNIAKAKAITIFAKVNIKDVCKQTEKVIDKANKKVKEVIKEEKSTSTKEPKWQKRFPFSFVFGGGKFQPIYFFVTMFSSLGVWMLYVKIHAASLAIKQGTYNPEMLSTADLATVLTFISSLILLYNNGKKNRVVKQSDDSDSGN